MWAVPIFGPPTFFVQQQRANHAQNCDEGELRGGDGGVHRVDARDFSFQFLAPLLNSRQQSKDPRLRSSHLIGKVNKGINFFGRDGFGVEQSLGSLASRFA